MYHNDTYLINQFDKFYLVSICYITIMDRRAENRRRNMLSLLNGSGMKSYEFADAIEVKPTYLTQLKKGREMDSEKGRNIGNAVASRIEKEFGKPKGWLDLDHSNSLALSPKREELQGQLNQLSDEGLETALTVIAGLVASEKNK